MTRRLPHVTNQSVAQHVRAARQQTVRILDGWHVAEALLGVTRHIEAPT